MIKKKIVILWYWIKSLFIKTVFEVGYTPINYSTIKNLGKIKLTGYKSLYDLDFEIAPCECRINADVVFMRFRMGTCEGLWGVDSDSYIIYTIENSKKGNGHFEDVMNFFHFICERDNKNLEFWVVLNKRFSQYLENNGFTERLDTNKCYLKILKNG